MNMSKIRELLEVSWSKETSYDAKNFTDQNKAWGQCAISALFIHDELGGDIIKAMAVTLDNKSYKHYWNRIKGIDVDLTWRQFPEGTHVFREEEVDISRLRKNPTVNKRYELLLTNMYNHGNRF